MGSNPTPGIPFTSLHHTPTPAARRPWEVMAVTILLAATVWVACFNFPVVWMLTGINEADRLFLDLRNLISASDSLRLGLDPYVSNPLDPYGRIHGYVDWWLITGELGITLKDVAWVGVSLLALVLVSAVLLVRPVRASEGLILFAVLVSPPILFAINRANHDLVVFILMCAALVCFRTPRPAPRALGVILLATSAVLKYFPLAAIVLLIEARTRRELTAGLLLYGSVLLLAWPSLERGFQNAAAHTPAPSWLYAFGAPVIFRNFELPHAAALGWLGAALLLLAGLFAWWTSLTRQAGEPPAADRNREREFACGAVMVVGCFLHGSSYLYKMVFALWLLSLLWQPAASSTEQRWRKTTLGLLLTVLWLEGGLAIALNLTVYLGITSPETGTRLLPFCLLAGQLATWALAFCLWRMLLVYLGREAPRLLPGRSLAPSTP